MGFRAFPGRLETYSLEVFSPKKQCSGSVIFMDPDPRIRNPELRILNYESVSGPDLQIFVANAKKICCQIGSISLKFIPVKS